MGAHTLAIMKPVIPDRRMAAEAGEAATMGAMAGTMTQHPPSLHAQGRSTSTGRSSLHESRRKQGQHGQGRCFQHVPTYEVARPVSISLSSEGNSACRQEVPVSPQKAAWVWCLQEKIPPASLYQNS